jgi:hypothetical protein
MPVNPRNRNHPAPGPPSFRHLTKSGLGLRSNLPKKSQCCVYPPGHTSSENEFAQDGHIHKSHLPIKVSLFLKSKYAFYQIAIVVGSLGLDGGKFRIPHDKLQESP